jgi:hypothetical protein
MGSSFSIDHQLSIEDLDLGLSIIGGMGIGYGLSKKLESGGNNELKFVGNMGDVIFGSVDFGSFFPGSDSC